MTALERLAEALREEGGLLAGTVGASDAPQPHGELVSGRGEDYPQLVEAIREGYLQHYDSGDLDSVAELADMIALSAQAHAEGDPARAEAVWDAGSAAIASGPTHDHQAAKRQWRGA